MDIEITATISFLEILWVVINLFGAYFTLGSYADARATLLAAREPPIDRVAEVLAKMAVFIQAAIGLTQLTFGGIGLWSMTQVPPPDYTGRTISVFMFIGVALLLAYKSYRVSKYRKEAMAILEEVYHEHHQEHGLSAWYDHRGSHRPSER